MYSNSSTNLLGNIHESSSVPTLLEWHEEIMDSIISQQLGEIIYEYDKNRNSQDSVAFSSILKLANLSRDSLINPKDVEFA